MSRKSPLARRSLVSEKHEIFREADETTCFADNKENVCPAASKFQFHEREASFYKADEHISYRIPKVTETFWKKVCLSLVIALRFTASLIENLCSKE